ncbi:MAG: hypothetical protein KAJ86_07190 [Alphaproteobacteria bacterium]|nr:hypothetical protein [Alphaproteobacteria bacterium]
MNKQLKKLLYILAWLIIIVFIIMGLLGNFAPHLVFEYPIIAKIVKNLWWLLIIATIIFIFVKNKDAVENTDNKNGDLSYKFTIIQALLIIIMVGLGMFAIALMTDLFGVFGIIGGMLGTSFYRHVKTTGLAPWM